MKPSTKWTIAIFLVVAGIVLACGLRIIRRGFSTRDQPSALEALLAETARSWATSAKAKAMTNPVHPSTEVYAEAGAHFADHCAQCHANNGSGDTLMGRNLYPRPPDIRLPFTQNKTDGELYHTIQYGVRLSGMPAFGEPVDNDQDTWKLVAFIRHLPKLSKEEEMEMEHLNPKSPDEMREEMEEDQFLNGGKPSASPEMPTTMHH
jgi:mono/diheme cytochrome c family protein